MGRGQIEPGGAEPAHGSREGAQAVELTRRHQRRREATRRNDRQGPPFLDLVEDGRKLESRIGDPQSAERSEDVARLLTESPDRGGGRSVLPSDDPGQLSRVAGEFGVDL